MNFNDLDVGDALESVTIDDLSGDDMKLLAALLQDPYPPHYDERRAEELGYPALLNQGPANLAYLLQPVLRVLESSADLRSFDTRYNSMVFAGQTVTATATVIEKRVADGEGLVEFDVDLLDPEGEAAVSGTVTARLPRDRDRD